MDQIITESVSKLKGRRTDFIRASLAFEAGGLLAEQGMFVEILAPV